MASYKQALTVATGGEYGQSACIVTSSLKYIHAFQRNAGAGMTLVNLARAGVEYHVPFGGCEDVVQLRA